MSSENPFRTLSSRPVYENPWMRVREDKVIRPDGSEGIYGIMESDDSVVIIAVNDQEQVHLIKAFSYPASAWSWTLPGGGAEREEPQVAAERELAEETGIIAGNWISLGKIRIAGGIITEQTTFFLARDLTFVPRIQADDSELISEGKFVSFDVANGMVQNGEVNDCQTITGMYLARTALNS